MIDPGVVAKFDQMVCEACDLAARIGALAAGFRSAVTELDAANPDVDRDTWIYLATAAGATTVGDILVEMLTTLAQATS